MQRLRVAVAAEPARDFALRPRRFAVFQDLLGQQLRRLRQRPGRRYQRMPLVAVNSLAGPEFQPLRMPRQVAPDAPFQDAANPGSAVAVNHIQRDDATTIAAAAGLLRQRPVVQRNKLRQRIRPSFAVKVD